MKKQIFEVGQEVLITMCKPKEGKFPIGKTEGGMICFLQKGSKGFFEYDSIWNCKVSFDPKDKNYLIVEPLEQVVSAASNRVEMAKKIELLKAEMGGKKQERKPKPVKSYPCLSKQEIRKEEIKN